MTTIRKELNRRGIYKYDWFYCRFKDYERLSYKNIPALYKRSTSNLLIPISILDIKLKPTKRSTIYGVLTLDATEEAKKLKL